MVADNICLHIKVGGDGSTSTEIDGVFLDHWPGLLALDIDAICVTTDDLVVANVDFVLRSCLEHDATRLEVLELALLDGDVSVD